MNTVRYQQVRELFDTVVALEPAARDARLREVAPELREEVKRLLKASVRGDWLDATSTTTPAECWEGKRLGPYELLSEIGQGGMGIVYLARRADGAFQKQVAIKIIRQDLATAEFLARFQREREILAKLEHPNIARLLDGGTTPNGLAYLVMEYIQGEPLLEYADSRSLPYDGRLSLLSEIAAAVDYAHEQGVIHRDLKPSNVFVDRRGHVKLLDFGIAAWQERPAAEREMAPTIALSPAYASPEQARGEVTTKATDIYSFGMVAYELLTGVLPLPVKGLPLADVLSAIAQSSPSAASAAAQNSTDPKPAALAAQRGMAASVWLERLELTADGPLARALAKIPAARPESAIGLVRELAATPPERGPEWRRAVSRFVAAWGELAVFASLLPGLALAGLVELKSEGWLVWGAVVGLAVWRRTGRASLATMWLMTLVSLTALTIFWKPETGPVVIGLLIAAGAAAALWYVRESATLGKRLLISKSARSMAILIVPLIGVLEFFYETWSREPAARDWFWVLLLSVALLDFLPLQIRRGGLMAGLSPLRWTDLASYCWVRPEVLELLRSRPGIGGMTLKVAVKKADRERVSTLLNEWLIEEPREQQRFQLLD